MGQPSMPPTPAIPAASASILLVRDTPGGMEVLVVERSRRMEFASGMLVFPGGRVDRADGAPRLRRRAEPRAGIADAAFRFAALRELFEETGVLLAGRTDRPGVLAEAARAGVEARFRRRLHGGRMSFAAVAERADLRFDLKRLVFFAHWVTPELSPKRFDTRFYLAAAPRGQRASSDGVENVHLAWRRPQDILAAWEARVQPLMFPTRLNLMKLARAASVAEALALARSTPVVRVQPEIGGAGQRSLSIPAEAGFGLTEATHRDLDPAEAAALKKAAGRG